MDETPETPPRPLIMRHDVQFLYDLAGRLESLGYQATGITLRELAGRVNRASRALMAAEESPDLETRPVAVEAAGCQ